MATRDRAGRMALEYVAMTTALLGLAGGTGTAFLALIATSRAVVQPLPASAEPSPVLISLRPSEPAPVRPVLRTQVLAITSRAASVTARPILLSRCRPLVPPPRPHPTPVPAPALGDGQPRRVRVGDANGRAVVARVYGGEGSGIVILPDGSLGWPNGFAYTDEPFRALSADQMARFLSEGPYRHFALHRTEHYLVFYTSTPEFARHTGKLLESLYQGLLKKFRDLDLPVHEAEFPLVAVVFRNETEFREHRAVARDVQAYYEVLSNRICLFETRDRDPEAPEVAALRKPQTVAHEGTHQILQNIGVQPRLAPWPAWLVEGLAEFSAPTTTRDGEWAGFGHTNTFHLATIDELADPLALQGRSIRLTRNRVGRALGRRTVADLVERVELTPTEYALAWGLTHFLATRRTDDFVAYLKKMSALSPLGRDAIEGAHRAFRESFGDDSAGMGQQLHKYLNGLERGKSLPYYAVIFEQPIGEGLFRRGTMVSQSPQMIQQWLETMADGVDFPFEWRVCPCASRASAFAAAERWINGR